MKKIEIEGRLFEIIVSSDVEIDGLVWELWEHVSDSRVLMLSITRHDYMREIEVKTFKVFAIPITALEALLEDFNTSGGRNFL